MTGYDPLISIIIPCWNAEKHVFAAVQSGLSQTYANVEIIVVNDGSNDGSISALSGVRDRIQILETDNRGACAARNTGLERASGDFIKFLDADDFLLPEAIFLQVRAIRNLEDNCFTVGRAYNLFEESATILPHQSAASTGVDDAGYEQMIVNVPVISSALHRRTMLEAIGGFRLDLPTRQDFDLFVRLLLAGARPSDDRVPVFVYRQHSEASRVSRRRSGADYSAIADMYESYLEGDEMNVPVSRLKMIYRGIAKSAWVTGRNALRSGHKDEALRLFQLARAMSPSDHMRGGKLYTIAAKKLGPFAAERLGSIRHRRASGAL